ncbi:hypothetical protein R5R35_012443 [Gryllus longicercus]|uniref:Uncharacterized protein n=1 Tax=Gryllus longicercus TaxID=2509291 RepID=A0AAN9VHI6_9ORTH
MIAHLRQPLRFSSRARRSRVTEAVGGLVPEMPSPFCPRRRAPGVRPQSGFHLGEPALPSTRESSHCVRSAGFLRARFPTLGAASALGFPVVWDSPTLPPPTSSRDANETSPLAATSRWHSLFQFTF